ncbi:MAG TPA: hypothetical protein VGC41_28405, partial [Kofleriaceae bacterium]
AVVVLGLVLWLSGVFGSGWAGSTIQNQPWQLSGDRSVGELARSRATVICTLPSDTCSEIAERTGRDRVESAPLEITVTLAADGLPSCGWPFRTSGRLTYHAQAVLRSASGSKAVGFHGEVDASASGIHACAKLHEALLELATNDINRQLEQSFSTKLMWRCPNLSLTSLYGGDGDVCARASEVGR